MRQAGNEAAAANSRAAAGLVAGLSATVPMSAAMGILQAIAPPSERYPPYPYLITARVAEKLGLARHMSRECIASVALVAHFGYGASAALPYAFLAPKLPMPGMLRGMLYGLTVWALGYQGWLPALGITPPATRMPPRHRNNLIVAHLVWGAALDASVRRDNCR